MRLNKELHQFLRGQKLGEFDAIRLQEIIRDTFPQMNHTTTLILTAQYQVRVTDLRQHSIAERVRLPEPGIVPALQRSVGRALNNRALLDRGYYEPMPVPIPLAQRDLQLKGYAVLLVDDPNQRPYTVYCAYDHQTDRLYLLHRP